MPKGWNYNKFDLINLKNIHRKFENTPLNHLPALGLWQYAYYQLLLNVERVNFLNWQEYNRAEIISIIEEKLGWRNYGGKHQESVFTRFYQGYILPNKFGIDKRKAHLSNLIFAGQISKEEALLELQSPPYDINLMKEDFSFVAKKLGFSNDEFNKILKLPNVEHEFYGTDLKQRQRYFKIMKTIKPISKIAKTLLSR